MKRIVMIIMAVALVALPTMAQNLSSEDQLQIQFQSTSTLQGSGSAYSASPSLKADGTAYSPSESSAPAGGGPRKASALPPTPEPGDGDTGNVPVGDPVLPLTLMALAFCGVIALRRRKLKASR